eukprot:scaffold26_cov158-Amphora_coffeaeformis.AAC.9
MSRSPAVVYLFVPERVVVSVLQMRKSSDCLYYWDRFYFVMHPHNNNELEMEMVQMAIVKKKADESNSNDSLLSTTLYLVGSFNTPLQVWYHTIPNRRRQFPDRLHTCIHTYIHT